MADRFKQIMINKFAFEDNWTYNRSNTARKRHKVELKKQIRAILKIDLRNRINENE